MQTKGGEMKQRLAWNSGKQYVQSYRPLRILWHALLATVSRQTRFHLTSLPLYVELYRGIFPTGEISILNIVGIKSGNRRTANVRSIGYSDLFCLSKEDLWDALKEYPEGKNKMLELGKQLLIKDNLLDTEAAEKAERRHTEFLDKLEHVEGGVDDVQTRFARLVAERGSSLQKLEKRIAKLDKILQLRSG